MNYSNFVVSWFHWAKSWVNRSDYRRIVIEITVRFFGRNDCLPLLSAVERNVQNCFRSFLCLRGIKHKMFTLKVFNMGNVSDDLARLRIYHLNIQSDVVVDRPIFKLELFEAKSVHKQLRVACSWSWLWSQIVHKDFLIVRECIFYVPVVKCFVPGILLSIAWGWECDSIRYANRGWNSTNVRIVLHWGGSHFECSISDLQIAHIRVFETLANQLRKSVSSDGTSCFVLDSLDLRVRIVRKKAFFMGQVYPIKCNLNSVDHVLWWE